MTKETCATCKFHAGRAPDYMFDNGPVHMCRKDSPVAGIGWPQVEPTDWCGEYVPAMDEHEACNRAVLKQYEKYDRTIPPSEGGDQ